MFTYRIWIHSNIGTIDEGDEDEEDREEELTVAANAEKKYAQSQIEAEWENIDKNPIQNNDNKEGTTTIKGKIYKKILYTEALEYLSNLDLSMYQNMITVKDEKSNSWSLVNRISELNFENNIESLRFPFLIAQLDYDDSNLMMFSIMQTIYKELILDLSKSILCPNVGPHWERIGIYIYIYKSIYVYIYIYIYTYSYIYIHKYI
jgi:hypothetical protein